MTHYVASASLISNLSSYASLRKSWKKEIFELLLEQNFFTFPKECLAFWRVTFDNLFTQDKYTFTELLGISFLNFILSFKFLMTFLIGFGNSIIGRVSVPQTGSLNIFSSKEVEYESRAMLLKRLAFIIFSSPKDQYTKFMTSIQGKMLN